MDDHLEKEIKRNEAIKNLIYTQLDSEKKVFADKIKEELGRKIVTELKSVKEVKLKKPSFWVRLLNIFK